MMTQEILLIAALLLLLEISFLFNRRLLYISCGFFLVVLLLFIHCSCNLCNSLLIEFSGTPTLAILSEEIFVRGTLIVNWFEEILSGDSQYSFSLHSTTLYLTL